MIEKLAKIENASLEIKERGILNFYISVKYEEGLSQCIGNIVLDTFDKQKKERVGTAYGCEMIRKLLIELNVNDFSEMRGKHIFVIGEGDGFSFNPKGLRSLRVDNKDSRDLIFDDVAKEFGLNGWNMIIRTTWKTRKKAVYTNGALYFKEPKLFEVKTYWFLFIPVYSSEKLIGWNMDKLMPLGFLILFFGIIWSYVRNLESFPAFLTVWFGTILILTAVIANI